ncbi:MAG TPA: sugar phosphate isomerase/epimerase [Thermoanaerobaculia bacterium]|nr:sugar phosphate isomerase/epimerase [Thermoanaerobaculia bacterium]
MGDWDVGLSTGCFYKEKILVHLEEILRSGFSRIEVCSYRDHLNYHDTAEVEEVASRLRDLQMEAYSFHAPFADSIDISHPDEEKRSRSLREMMQAAEAAARLQARFFVVHPGPEAEIHGTAEEHYQRRRLATDALKGISQRCTELGIGFVLENKLSHLLFGSASDLLWFAGALDAGNLGLCLDIGHAHLSGDLHGMIRRFSGLMRMVHAHDNHGERDDHLPLGKGTIDWRHTLTLLSEIGFEGTIVLEFESNGSPESLLEGARRSRQLIRDLLRQLGTPRRPGNGLRGSQDST